MSVRGSRDGIGRRGFARHRQRGERARPIRSLEVERDHTYAELVAHVEEEQRLLEAGEPLMGHPSFATEVASRPLTESRGQTTMSFDASAGEYGMTCIQLERSLAAAGPFVVR